MTIEDPELKKLLDHPAVQQYLKAAEHIPELTKNPPSLRRIIKDYEEQKEQERNRPRINSLNPPAEYLREAARLDRHWKFIFGLGCAFVASGIIGILKFENDHPTEPLNALEIFITCAFIFFAAWIFYDVYADASHASNLKKPIPLAFIELTFNPRLQDGSILTITTTFQVPISFDSSDFRAQLLVPASAALSSYFAKTTIIPTHEKIAKFLTDAVTPHLLELNLPVLRVYIIKVEAAAAPPPKSPPGTPIGFRRG
jgi:hypothetical protein